MIFTRCSSRGGITSEPPGCAETQRVRYKEQEETVAVLTEGNLVVCCCVFKAEKETIKAKLLITPRSCLCGCCKEKLE